MCLCFRKLQNVTCAMCHCQESSFRHYKRMGRLTNTFFETVTHPGLLFFLFFPPIGWHSSCCCGVLYSLKVIFSTSRFIFFHLGLNWNVFTWFAEHLILFILYLSFMEPLSPASVWNLFYLLSSDSGVAKCARYPRDRDTEQCFFSPKVFIYSEMRGRWPRR